MYTIYLQKREIEEKEKGQLGEKLCGYLLPKQNAKAKSARTKEGG